MDRAGMYEDPQLVQKRIERETDRLERALWALKDEQTAAFRSLTGLEQSATATQGREQAWRRIISALGAAGYETPEQIADMVVEETDAARCICGILDLPRETRPEALVEHVRRVKDRLKRLEREAT